ncbi:MAG: formylglycine-generating enzyme family protein [Desulfuromonadaceae bacterium]|nr:formylglycine-generating enzyme family protein [Desulfuromonadaceae bacterium]
MKPISSCFVTITLVLICAVSALCGASKKDAKPETEVATVHKEIERNMVKVKGGCFRMGDIFGREADIEKPIHEVCLSDYSISKYEVTQGQWRKIVGNDPSNFNKCGDDCPVEKVSWKDTQIFISSLNRQTGGSFRLPTEAEWEYACRSGKMREKYCGGDKVDEVAWYAGNSGGKSHPVGQKKPNVLGIYDMNGNVSEWVNDRYSDYTSANQQNPQGPSSASSYMDRGGSWRSSDRFVDAARRSSNPPDYFASDLGFRIASPSH